MNKKYLHFKSLAVITMTITALTTLPSIAMNTAGDKPQLVSIQVFDDKLIADQSNRIPLNIEFIDSGRNLIGGKLLLIYKEDSGNNDRVETNLNDKIFKRKKGSTIVYAAIDLTESKTVTFKARLIDADGRKSGWKKFALSTKDYLYDDFDGHGGFQKNDNVHLAEKGTLSATQWTGEAEFIKKKGHGYVAKFNKGNGEKDGKTLYLANPWTVKLEEMKTISADIMIPSKSSCQEYWVSLGIGLWLSDPYEGWWSADIRLGKSRWGNGISAGWHNVKSNTDEWIDVPAELDRWYNLRMDIQKIKNSTLEISFFVNSELITSGILEDSGALLDLDKWDHWNQAWINHSPKRTISIWKSKKAGDAVVCIDNVKSLFYEQVPPLAPLYDDFDGHGGQQNNGSPLATDGTFSPSLWSYISPGYKVVRADQYLRSELSAGHRNVMVCDIAPNLNNRITLIPPSLMWEECKSFSYDILIPSSQKGREFGGMLDHHGGRIQSWYSMIGVKVDPDGQYQSSVLVGDAMAVPRGTRWIRWRFRKLDYDKWYNLRTDIIPVDGLLKFDYYVNNILLYSVTPPYAEGPLRGYWPSRRLNFSSEEESRVCRVFLDNFKAVYEKR